MKGKLHFERITPEVARIIEAGARKDRPHPLLSPSSSASRNDLFTESDLRVARAIFEECAVGPLDSEVLRQARAILPSWVFTAVVLVCGCRVGLENLEKTQGWPARSAKLVVAIGLEELARRGVA